MSSQRLVLFAKHVLTMDRPKPVEDGFVLIQGHRILQVGKRRDLFFLPQVRMLDLGNTLLMPGLINAHCHLDYTLFKGKVPYGGNFRQWLGKMGAKARAAQPGDFRKAVSKGIQESLASGTTTLVDTSTSLEGYSLLRQSALRAFFLFEILDFGQPSPKRYWKTFLEKLRLLTQSQPPTPTFQWGLSPHTPYTVSRELLGLSGRYVGERRNLLTSIHLAESRQERDFFRTGRGPIAQRTKELNPDWAMPRHTTPVRFLSQAGWLPKLDLGVHLNLVEEKDARLLAKNRVAVVHCPGSHRYFRHPKFGYARMRAAGVPVCLGTDSLASNQSLSLFREMALFRESHPRVPAHEILSLATVRAAQALGEGRQLGQIRPGYTADIIGIPGPKTGGKRGLFDKVLDHRGPVSFSMVHGEIRLRIT